MTSETRDVKRLIEDIVRKYIRKEINGKLTSFRMMFIILGLTLVTLVMRYSPFYTYILLITIISRKNVV